MTVSEGSEQRANSHQITQITFIKHYPLQEIKIRSHSLHLSNITHSRKLKSDHTVYIYQTLPTPGKIQKNVQQKWKWRAKDEIDKVNKL